MGGKLRGWKAVWLDLAETFEPWMDGCLCATLWLWIPGFEGVGIIGGSFGEERLGLA